MVSSGAKGVWVYQKVTVTRHVNHARGTNFLTGSLRYHLMLIAANLEMRTLCQIIVLGLYSTRH